VVDVLQDDDGGWAWAADGEYVGYVPSTYIEYI
jgi:hypothetical protein